MGVVCIFILSGGLGEDTLAISTILFSASGDMVNNSADLRAVRCILLLNIKEGI
jgi:hypothetical protein